MTLSSKDYSEFEKWQERTFTELLQFMAYLQDIESQKSIQI